MPQSLHGRHRGRHAKKTWVTDVNVFSKKKKGDELDQFFQEDDDPMDEYGRAFNLYCY